MKTIFYLILPSILAFVPLCLGDQYERVLECYREQNQIAVKFNQVLDTVGDEESMQRSISELAKLNAQVKQNEQKAAAIPEDSEPPVNQILRFSIVMHDEHALLNGYLLEQNLMRIKKLGLRSDGFDREIKAWAYPAWPELNPKPLDLMRELESAQKVRQQWREAAASFRCDSVRSSD